MFALLVVAAAIYLVLGDLGEASVLSIFATLSVVVTIVQESRSERVIESLRDLSSPRALVIRQGVRRRIPGREVVRGDVIAIAEGDRIPADALLLSGTDVHTDESLLTGESVPVRKSASGSAGRTAMARPGGDDLPYLFSGSLIVRGHGLAEVFVTGPKTEMGRIGMVLGRIESEPPLLRKQTQPLVRILAIASLVLSAVVVLLYGSLRGSWFDGLLAGVALSMSLLPEELPLVLTVFTVMGAWRISQARVLTRRAAAIEMLGAATVLCSDKTGTLTKNAMSVAELRVDDEVFTVSDQPTLPDRVKLLVEYGILASAREPFDPMEKALHSVGDHLADKHQGWALINSQIPEPDFLAMIQVWKDPGSDRFVVAAKGAPETITHVCGLDAEQIGVIHRAVDQMAANGMRVLAVARANINNTGQFDSLRESKAFEFLGLIGFADPLRPAVPAAVRECHSAGIRVVMITGDYPATARAIANQAGLTSGPVITGKDLDDTVDAQLNARVREATVFARIMPEQKLRIVEALKKNGDVVAMTGDGVNDAPSLKAAHIGIAMGGRGTDVAREAAAIVLLDDDFGSIVRTIRLGRRIYDNLRKAMGYIIAVHVPIAGLALLPLLFGWPLILTPIHIAFLEMVIDPVCSVAFEAEPEESDVMKRPPRDPSSPLFSTALTAWSLFQGTVVLVLVGLIYVMALRYGLPEDETRALTFVSLVLTNVGLIFVNRSFEASVAAAFQRRNVLLWAMVGAIAALLLIIAVWPSARGLFHFGPLHLHDLFICVGAGLGVLLALDTLKPVVRRWLVG